MKTMIKSIKTEFGECQFEKTPEMCEKVFDYLIENYYKKYEAFSGEIIMQDDDCQIYAPEVLSKIADNVIEFKLAE